MQKIVRNDSVSTITLDTSIGISISSGESYILTVSEYLRWGEADVISDLTPLINSGDLVVNDGTNDLSAADGIRYLKYADRHYVQKDGIDITRVVTTTDFVGSNVIVTDKGDGKVEVEPSIENALGNDLDTLQFGRNGVVSNNTWLLNLNNIPSNTSPTVLAYSSLFRQISWSNSNNADDFTVELYKASETNPNSRTLFYSETFSGRAGHTGTDQNIVLAEGQALSAKVINVGNPKPSEIIVTLWMRQG